MFWIYAIVAFLIIFITYYTLKEHEPCFGIFVGAFVTIIAYMVAALVSTIILVAYSENGGQFEMVSHETYEIVSINDAVTYVYEPLDNDDNYYYYYAYDGSSDGSISKFGVFKNDSAHIHYYEEGTPRLEKTKRSPTNQVVKFFIEPLLANSQVSYDFYIPKGALGVY